MALALLAVVVIGALAALAPSDSQSAVATGPAANADLDQYRTAGWIKTENELPGTTDWVIPDEANVWEKIRGYADQVSVNREGKVTLYVSTPAPTFDVAAYRMGWYGGDGGRLIWSQDGVAGTEQPDPEQDRKTNVAETTWTPSLDVGVTREWPPGAYLFVLRTDDGGASYIPLTVRDDESTAALLVQSSVTTWQAYNEWGGAGLYFGGADRDPDKRAQVVSFDRPYGGNGSGEFFGREREFIYFAERLGLDLTYWTDVDLHEQPELVQHHQGFVSLGHDEYYTTVMRQGLEDGRDAGVNLVFFGANAMYRRIRLEASPLGPSRHEVNYRVAADDPLNGKDDKNVTTSFREPPAANPESKLIGDYYECNPVDADMVIADASAWVFDGTGLEDDDVIPGIVGNEYDRVTPEAPTPDNIQVLAHSPVKCKGVASYADVSYYSADSGAGVFATGTLWWIGDQLLTDCHGDWTSEPDCQIQRTTENLLRAFSEPLAGKRHPSKSNLADLGIEEGYISPLPK